MAPHNSLQNNKKCHDDSTDSALFAMVLSGNTSFETCVMPHVIYLWNDFREPVRSCLKSVNLFRLGSKPFLKEVSHACRGS